MISKSPIYIQKLFPKEEVNSQVIYLVPLGTNPEGDSCFSIYQNTGIKMHFLFKETIQYITWQNFRIGTYLIMETVYT